MARGGSKDIQNIRTFALDAALARSRDSQIHQPGPASEKPEPPKPQRTIAAVAEQPRTSIPSRTKQKSSTSIPKKPHEQPTPASHISAKHLDIAEELQSLEPEKESLLSEKDDPFEVNPQQGGSIIRDTKRKRFRLFPAMAEAAAQWVDDQKKAYDTFRHPHHAVTKAEARKEVIEEAVKHGAQAPKEDFEEIAERMRGKKRTVTTSALTFKKKAEVKEPTWTYLEEENRQQSAEIPVSDTGAAARPMHAPDEPLPVVPQAQTEPEMPVSEAPIEPEVLERAEPTADETGGPAEAEYTTPEPATVDIPVPEPEVHSPAAAARTYAMPQAIPRHLGLAFLGVVVLASALGIGASYYFFVLKDAPQQIAVVYTIPSLITVPDQQPVTLQEHSLLLADMQQLIQNAPGALQIYPTIENEDGVQPAPASDILQKLAFQAPGSFTRSIREIVFGASSRTAPFMVLHTATFDTAFAGMLAWEKTMSADLAPLFGEPVVETFDPSARTATQVREAFFKDTIASNRNVRLLLDEKGDDRIIYTFVDQNTILITTTRESLEELLPLIR